MTTRAPRILVSVDSTWFYRSGLGRFTYNRWLSRAGCFPRQVRFAEAMTAGSFDSTRFDRLLKNIDGILLTGGGDIDSKLYGADAVHHRSVKPLRDRFELALLELANERGMPVLGVCRGAQLLNVFCGGSNRSLRRDPELIRHHRRRGGHDVRLLEGSKLAGMLSQPQARISVSSYHAHAVKDCGQGLTVAAVADDEVIEAVEGTADQPWRLGVQWHPEWMRGDANQIDIARSFKRAATAFAGGQ